MAILAALNRFARTRLRVRAAGFASGRRIYRPAISGRAAKRDWETRRGQPSEEFLAFSGRFTAGNDPGAGRGIMVIYFGGGIGDDAHPAQRAIRDAPSQRFFHNGS
jgi:hypothetical protein